MPGILTIARMIALPRWAKIAVGIIALCLLAFTLHKCAIRDAVKADRKSVEAETATRTLSSERSANRADAARQAEIQASDAQTRKDIADAVDKDPEGARAAAGPAARAAADSLRHRAAGGGAPAR